MRGYTGRTTKDEAGEVIRGQARKNLLNNGRKF